MIEQRYPLGDPDDWMPSLTRRLLLPRSAWRATEGVGVRLHCRYDSQLLGRPIDWMPIDLEYSFGLLAGPVLHRVEAVYERRVLAVARRGRGRLRS